VELMKICVMIDLNWLIPECRKVPIAQPQSYKLLRIGINC
jgi:hypothetical protein